MEFPKVSNLVVDPKRNITIDIRAYRKLSEHEMTVIVRQFQLMQKKKLKNNSTYTIPWLGD